MADNSAAFAALDEQLERLRKVESMNEDCAHDVAEGFQQKVEENVANQVDPYGHAWRTAKDGLPVLINAASHVTNVAKGTAIETSLNNPVDVRHHVGSARGYRGGSGKLGGFRRSIIPFSKLPGPFKAVIRERLQKRFNEIKGGT